MYLKCMGESFLCFYIVNGPNDTVRPLHGSYYLIKVFTFGAMGQ